MPREQTDALEKTILHRKNDRRWKHSLQTPLRLWWFVGTISTLPGLWRKTLAQVRLWKPPLEQNYSPGRNKKPVWLNTMDGGIPQLGHL